MHVLGLWWVDHSVLLFEVIPLSHRLGVTDASDPDSLAVPGADGESPVADATAPQPSSMRASQR
jgi:hypothetical protein